MREDTKAVIIKFKKKVKVSEDVFTFHFTKPANYKYKAGEYLKIKLPIDKTDDRGINRYFTISSSPFDPDLTITTRIVKSTFKKSLANLKPGAKIKIRGPWGEITLNEKSKKPYVILAGGIGLTPAHSIMTYAAQKKLKVPITLIVSFDSKSDFVFYDELQKIKSKYLKPIYIETQKEGRINEAKIKKYVDDVKGSIYFLTGPLAFVETMQKLLKSMKISPKNIITEDFPGY